MKLFRKVTALMLAALMTVQFLPEVPVSFADEGESGTFAMAAIDQDGIVIEPCLVEYQSGQSITDALLQCGHQFDGLEDGWIETIDGHTDNYVRYYDNGEYNLDRPASDVKTALLFTVGELPDPTNHLELVKLLAEHEKKDEAIRKYGPVKKAYQAASENLPTANSAKAKTLADDLKAAYARYETWISQQKTVVKIRPMQNGSNVSATVTVTDSMDNVYQKEGSECTFELLEETYDFSVTKDDKEVSGSFEVKADDTELSFAPMLPTGKWFGNIRLKDSDKVEATSETEGNTTTVYLQDTTYSPYINVTPGQDIPLNDDGTPNTKDYSVFSEHTSFAIGRYYGDETVSSNKVSWSSNAKRLVEVAEAGLEEKTVRLKVVHKDADSGYTQRMFHFLVLRKIPTLKGLTVKAGSNKLPLDPAFDVRTDEYSVETIADTVSVSGASYVKGNDTKAECGRYSEGYSVSVNGQAQEENGSVSVDVDPSQPITVTVSGTNGLSSTYRIDVSKVSSRTVEVTKPSAGTSVNLETSTGSIINPDSEDDEKATFIVAPGNYSWVTTRDTYYHAKSSFNVSSGTSTMQVESAAPVKEQLMSGISMYSGTFATAVRYEEADGKEFNWEDHEYSFLMSDFATTVYILTEFDSSVTLTRGEFMMVNGYPNSSQTLKSGTKTLLTRLIGQGTSNNHLTLTAEKTSGNVTYYQDYNLSTRRFATLDDLKPADKAGNPLQIFANGDESETEFDSDINEYTMNIGATAEEVRITAKFSNPEQQASSIGDSIITIDGESFRKSESDLTVTKAVALDPDKDEETIDIVLSDDNPENGENTYHLKVIKVPPMAVKFALTPSTATVYVTDDISGNRVLPESDGSFALLKGFSYTYTATAYGYVGKRGKVSVTENATITVVLDEAPENSSIDTGITAEWPYFRADEHNNGIVDHPVPKSPDDTVLYWAKKVGDGYSTSAAGCPIMADGYIYTYTGNTIVKLDPMTGDKVAEGTMYTGSAFAINSPTYAEGMIFVGLNNGGIQAFNAKTLDSLWIYKDIFGGQPNCQISYKDGYIYTGYWNSETKQANCVCLSVTDEDPLREQEEKLPVWTYTGNGFYWAGAEVSGGHLIIGSDDGKAGYSNGYGVLLSLDPLTGEVIDQVDDQFKGDIRSSVCYDTETDRYYFTTKDGVFCSIKLNEDGTFNRSSATKLQLYEMGGQKGMSTSTPVVHNGRAYVGVGGTGQFAQYTGHNITVIDLTGSKPVIAYKVATQGYPQTSGLLTTAYEGDDGSVYVYFFDNFTPGKLRVIKDKPGQTEPDPETLSTEAYESAGQDMTCDTAMALFTPYGDHGQYAICSPISDEWGNIYFKNDTGYMMKIGAKITKLEVTSKPDKTEYRVGDLFDKRGLKVTATYANGKKRDVTDYIKFTTEPLTLDDTEIDLFYDTGENMDMYQDHDGEPGAAYFVPQASVTIKIRDAGFVPTPISGIQLSASEFEYNGARQRPEVSLYNGDTRLVEGTDYIITWPEESIEAGTYTLTVEGTGDYTGVLTAEYTIKEVKQPEEITSLDLSETEFEFNGLDQRPEITLINKRDSLKQGVDYTVEWPEESVNVGTYTVKVTGIGDYTGTASATYTIKEAVQLIEIVSVELTETQFYFNGETQRPQIKKINGSSALIEGTDYTVLWPEESIDAGTYTVTVTGIGAFTGTMSVEYTIGEAAPKEKLQSLELSRTVFSYNGQNQRPEIKAINGRTDLVEGEDYIVAWPQESIYFAVYTVTVTGIGEFTGIVSATYEIKEDKTPEALVSLELSRTTFSYTGEEQRPAIRSINGITNMEEGVDYTVVWPESSVEAGEYTVTVTGIGLFTGTVTAKYTIERVIEAEQINTVELNRTEFPYNGKNQRPKIVSFNGKTERSVEEGIDFTAEWPEESVNAGTYTVRITGIGLFTGTVTVSYTIDEEKPPIVFETLELSRTEFSYNGKDQRPEIVSINGMTGLEENVDYTVDWPEESIYMNTYYVTVTGIGAYTGSVSASYTIGEVKELITVTDVTLSAVRFTYDGKKHIPQVRAVNGNYLLEENVDYFVTRPVNPVNAGKYRILVTGSGDYVGSAYADYRIIKAANKLTVKPLKKTIKRKKKFLVKASAKGNAKITYKITKGKKYVKLIKKGKKYYVKSVKKGKAVITVTAAATKNYKKATKKIKVTVK